MDRAGVSKIACEVIFGLGQVGEPTAVAMVDPLIVVIENVESARLCISQAKVQRCQPAIPKILAFVDNNSVKRQSSVRGDCVGESLRKGIIEPSPIGHVCLSSSATQA